MRFGLQIGFHQLDQVAPTVELAESLGFDAVYFPDHLIAEGPERQRVPEPSYDPMVQATIAALASKRVEIGHLVLCNLFRHPAITARSLATLDELSGGRLVAGLGTGWTETEFRMTGIEFPDIGTRLRMLDEALTCLTGLWSGEPFTFAGEFYRFQDATLLPRPRRRPPILLGGGGRGLLRVAARHADRVNVIADVGRQGHISFASTGRLDDGRFRAKIDFLRKEAAAAGRNAAAIELSTAVFMTVLADSPTAARASAEGMAAMMQTTPDAIVRMPLALIGTPDACVAELRRREREWGLAEMIFSFTGKDALRRLGTEVLAEVRRPA